MHQRPMVRDHGTHYEDNSASHHRVMHEDGHMDWTLSYIPQLHLGRVGTYIPQFRLGRVWNNNKSVSLYNFNLCLRLVNIVI